MPHYQEDCPDVMVCAHTKLNQRRKAALYMAMYGGSYGYHLLWLFSRELGVKIPPVVNSGVSKYLSSPREKCSLCEYFDADAQGEYGNCTVGERTHEDGYCMSYERRT